MSETIVLAPKLDLSAASELMTILRAQDAAEVEIDMSEVKHLGALCLQVLLAAAKTSRTENRTITITNTSDRVIDQMRVMGMTPETIAKGYE